MIEESQVIFHEGDEPDSIAHLFDADVLSGEDLAETDLALADADTAAIEAIDESIESSLLLQEIAGGGLGGLQVANTDEFRKKLEVEPERPEYIVTEPWVGYRFADIG